MFKKIIQRLVIIVQKVIMSASLFIIYYFIIGFAVVIGFLFNRRILAGKARLQDSTWLDAVGYDKDMLDSKMQS